MSEAVMENTFTVETDSAAEWCLKKIREAEQDRQLWKRHYEEEMRKIDENCNSTIEFFKAKLEEYFENVPHKTAKTQESYVLPSGKLVRKKQQPEYKVDDSEVVPWLKANNQNAFVKIKEAADWAGMKKSGIFMLDGGHIITEDGEIVPGITVTEREDKFVVEVSE